MRGKFIGFIFLVITGSSALAQQFNIDSLYRENQLEKNDTTRLVLLGKLADGYSELKPDSAYFYADKMLGLASKLDLKLEQTVALGQMGYAMINLGNYPHSLQLLLQGIAIAEVPASEAKVLPVKFDITDEFTDRTVPAHLQRLSRLSRILQYAGILYSNMADHRKGLFYFDQALVFSRDAGNLPILSITYTSMGRNYLALKQPDSAIISLDSAYIIATKANYLRYVGSTLLLMDRVYLMKANLVKAKEYFNRSGIESNLHGYFRGVAVSNLWLAEVCKQLGQKDSILYYLNRGVPMAGYLNAPDILVRFYREFAAYFTTTDNHNDSTVKYQSLIIQINDSLFNSKQVQQFQSIDFDEQQRLQQIESAKTAYRNKIRQVGLLVGLAVIFLVAFLLYRNNRHKQKANMLLAAQKEKVESTLQELKSTQVQLIQSEKMASLGELTAGIAHEIQNPLNFVNNFSEINRELLTELSEEIEKENYSLVKDIAKDVIINEEKINHHGKRADAIVKGMLQHSQTSIGQKEPTDINKLVGEYLRLAYHAGKTGFNAVLETNFDQQVGDWPIIKGEIGRVLLNLINNAFYAVNEKSKLNKTGYQPTVTITTKKEGDRVELIIADNGNGIPEKLIDKIFQPFFTTKPTGQGTGLGLSLSYDIIKAHGGSISARNIPGGGAEFVVTIPKA